MPVKRFMAFCLLMLLCITATGAEAAPAAPLPKFRVAVSEFIMSDAVTAKKAATIRASNLMASIENAIRNSRKFDVVTRRGAALQAIRAEQEFAKSELSAGDAAAEGQLSNAQALVSVEVLSFAFARSAKPVPNLDGKWTISDYCTIKTSVQIIDTAKGTILASFPIKASTGDNPRLSNSVGGPNPVIMQKTMEKVAAALANNLTDTIFPLKVLAVKNGQLWVNRGNDSGMKAGDVFEIFQPAEALIDPDTGENLGSAETLAGRGKVVRVNPKFSIVNVIKGEAAYMQQGYILRRPVK